MNGPWGGERSRRRWVVQGVVALCLLGALPVRAADPLVAVHPLVVLEGEASETARLQRLFRADIAERNLDLVKPPCIEDFLAKLPRQGCGADDGCLAKLASACGAQRALYVAVVPGGQKVTFSGKVVRAGGFTERTVSGVEVHRRSGVLAEPMLKKALHDFLSDDLKLDSMDLPALVEAPPAAAASPSAPLATAPAATATPRKGLSPLRVAGWSVGGAALGVAVAGSAVALASIRPRRQLAAQLDANGRITGNAARGAALQRTLNAESQATEGLFISAGVLAASSVVMLILSKDAPETAPQVSFGASGHDVGFAVGGRF